MRHREIKQNAHILCLLQEGTQSPEWRIALETWGVTKVLRARKRSQTMKRGEQVPSSVHGERHNTQWSSSPYGPRHAKMQIFIPAY